MFRDPYVGSSIRIESYKHDRSLHRAWKQSVILDEKDPFIVANCGTEVTENDGKTWITSELAICQFHRAEWFHTIILFKDKSNYNYYCNIASPYRIDKGILSYIDYDLDLVVDADGNFKWLDYDEFMENKVRYKYPASVLAEIEKAVTRLEERVQKRFDPFNSRFAHLWYHRFLSIQKK